MAHLLGFVDAGNDSRIINLALVRNIDIGQADASELCRMSVFYCDGTTAGYTIDSDVHNAILAKLVFPENDVEITERDGRRIVRDNGRGVVTSRPRQ